MLLHIPSKGWFIFEGGNLNPVGHEQWTSFQPQYDCHQKNTVLCVTVLICWRLWLNGTADQCGHESLVCNLAVLVLMDDPIRTVLTPSFNFWEIRGHTVSKESITGSDVSYVITEFKVLGNVLSWFSMQVNKSISEALVPSPFLKGPVSCFSGYYLSPCVLCSFLCM